MKKNTIYWVLGAIAAYWILKKKGIIGDISNEARELTAEEVQNLNFALDTDSYEEEYRRQQQRPEVQNLTSDAKICN